MIRMVFFRTVRCLRRLRSPHRTHLSLIALYYWIVSITTTSMRAATESSNVDALLAFLHLGAVIKPVHFVGAYFWIVKPQFLDLITYISNASAGHHTTDPDRSSRVDFGSHHCAADIIVDSPSHVSSAPETKPLFCECSPCALWAALFE